MLKFIIFLKTSDILKQHRNQQYVKEITILQVNSSTFTTFILFQTHFQRIGSLIFEFHSEIILKKLKNAFERFYYFGRQNTRRK